MGGRVLLLVLFKVLVRGGVLLLVLFEVLVGGGILLLVLFEVLVDVLVAETEHPVHLDELQPVPPRIYINHYNTNIHSIF